MTDLPKPSDEGAADLAAPDAASSGGDPDLASLVFGGSRPAAADEGDPSLAALVNLGRRPVSAAVPPAVAPAGTPADAAPDAEAANAASETAAEAPVEAVDAPVADASPAAEAAVAATTEADATAEPATPADAAPAADDAAPPAAADTAPASDAEGEAAPEPVAADAAPELPVAAAVAEPPAVEPWEPPVHGGHRRSLALRFSLAFLFGVLLVVGVGAGALYAWGQQYDGRVLPGVRVGSTDLSGMTRDQAQAVIAKAYGSLGTGQITLNGPNGPVTVSYADVGRGADTTAILDAALAAGRSGEPFAALIGGPQVALHGVTLSSAVTYDRAKLTATVDNLVQSIDEPAVDAAIAPDGAGGLAVTPSKDGRSVDENALLAQIDQQLTSLDAPASLSFDVPVATVKPAIETAAAEAAKASGDRMVADLVIARGTDTWTITSAQLRPLVTFVEGGDGTYTPVFNDAGLDPILKTLAKSVNQTPQDATLRLVGNHVVAAGKSREGRTLQVPAMKAAIVAQMAARQAGTAVEPLQAVVKAVQPKLSSADAAKFAPKMVAYSSYSVYYWVIINNHFGGNIEGPANVINGTVIPAGGVFDFWKVVGDLHKVPGVGPGNAIEGGKITVTGAFGGGICTTSTTLFNAAFRAGMIPMARQNHNEFIDRYPPGLDATVWIVGTAKQTMSFKNDTAYPILISRNVTYAGSKRWLTFKIWTVPNGRRAVVSNTVIQPGQKAIDTVVKDPTKPIGYSYRNNAPADGAKVWVTVTIYDHGKVHWTKRYYSNYPAVNGVLIVGTKKTTSPTPSPSPGP